jgi:hypothetical protein
MGLRILSCGIFQPELEHILPDVRHEPLDRDIAVSFVAPALHVDYKKLKDGIAEGFRSLENPSYREEKSAGGIVLLYGSMCHPDIAQMAGEHGAVCPREGNCIDMFLSPERKKEMEGGENVFFMTTGWFKHWRGIFRDGQGWDAIDARMNFGRYDKILILDSGISDFAEEEILDLFDYTQVPIDIEPVAPGYFKDIVVNACLRAAKGKAAF